MRTGVIVLLIAVAGFCMPPAYAQHDAGVGALAQAAPIASVVNPSNIPQRGALYRVQHQNNTVYLFGTIHVGMPGFFPLEPKVIDALHRARKLVLEIDVRKGDTFQDALKQHGMYASGDSIERHLSAPTLMQLRKALDSFGIPLESVRHFKPWLLANMLLGLDLDRHGYQRRHGIEYFLLSVADGQTKAVEELETAEYQMSLFNGMSDATQEQYLRENLAELDDGNALKKARSLIDAWASANGKALNELLQASLDEKTASAEFTHRVLLDKRNPEMANKIEALLRSDDPAFVGVGLLHLLGDTGVPTLLRSRGYAVEKIY